MPRNVPGNARLFLFGMVLSGLGDGIILVVAQLYVVALGFDSATIGTIFMLKFASTALLTIPVGVIADRHGKARILASGLLLFSVGMSVLLSARTVDLFSLSMVLIGFSDATFVVLGPLYSSFFEAGDMDTAFGLQMFLNIAAVSMGSLMGYIPPMLVDRFGLTLEASYWALMLVAAVLFFLRAPFYLLSTRGINEPRGTGGFRFGLASTRIVAKFSLLAAFGQIGYNILFSLFPFYMNRKFGVESDALGALLFISFIVSALANVVGPRISGRLGTLRTIVLSMALSAPFYFVISLAPSFAWLSVIYVIRRGIANVSSPLGTSLFMRLLRPEEKSTANSITQTTSMVSIALATWLAGQLMEVSLDIPVYVGTGLYVINAAAYFLLLRDEEAP